MPPARTLDQIHKSLRHAAVAKGYTTFPRLGGPQSQTFEFQKGGVARAIVAYRDVGKKTHYATPTRLWIEGLDLVLRRYSQLQGSVKVLPPAFAIVVDNIRNAYLVVPIQELLQLYLKRVRKPHPEDSRQFTFTIEARSAGYFLVMPDGLPARPIPDVNSLAPVLAVL